MFYTSRSAIETRQQCSRKRFLNYHYKEKGIVPTSKSIPLTTGICVHKGIQYLCELWKFHQIKGVDINDWIEQAVLASTLEYNTLLENKGFLLTLDKEQEFVREEQLALTEALVRAWGMKEFPLLIKNFRILEVEKELNHEFHDMYGSQVHVLFQGRADLILETKDPQKDVLIYSLKTIREFSWWIERSYKRDLQGITESFLVNQFLKERNEILANANIPDFLPQVKELLESYKTHNNVSGVKFCYLVKGNRKESEYEPGHYITYNPLIRGYRNDNLSKFAHSWKFPNPNNKSGESILGKGWLPFNVWESEYWNDLAKKEGFSSAIKRWMHSINIGEVQPECSDPIKGCVITPVEVRREQREINEDINIIETEEIEFFKKLQVYSNFTLEEMFRVFGKTRKNCDYPIPCEYLPICYGEDAKDNPVDSLVQIDPIKSGMYEERTPHHSEGEL